MYVRRYVCLYVCMCVCIYIYIYILGSIIFILRSVFQPISTGNSVGFLLDLSVQSVNIARILKRLIFLMETILC